MSSFAVRVLAVLLVAVLAGLGATLVLDSGPGGPPKLVPGSGEAPGRDDEAVDPLAYTPAREAQLAAAAARGHAHVIFAKSPGGTQASAARTARYRPVIETVAKADGLDPDTLEAIVLLESAGRPDAIADPQLEGAVGLTQILAETGRNLLGMQVDPAAARRVSRSIARAARRGKRALVQRLRERRRQIDERFDPAKSIRAMARYLVFARGKLRRDDLAVASYHMGVGNVETVLGLYGDSDVSYARLYFDSTPLRNPRTYAKLASLGDDSSTYLWRVMAAREVMRVHRTDPDQLDRLSALHSAKNSAEEVLHPRNETQRFDTPGELRRAYRDGRIRELPRALLARHGLQVDRDMGELAPRLNRSRKTYRGLRPEALALLVYLGAGVEAISGREPLAVTSTVRDRRYQRLLVAGNIEATRNYSLHTTGWAFDIRRSYRSRAQGQAFEFMLGRLQSLDLIAWVREPAAIHVTVSSRAEELLDLLG
ncbi:MAG: transglycosylase SLT domain-containing protein [Actinomycetota bacterium]|nr:transglycosylase SLT domain-containing protein [Actinomycetota bacterium]